MSDRVFSASGSPLLPGPGGGASSRLLSKLGVGVNTPSEDTPHLGGLILVLPGRRLGSPRQGRAAYSPTTRMFPGDAANPDPHFAEVSLASA